MPVHSYLRRPARGRTALTMRGDCGLFMKTAAGSIKPAPPIQHRSFGRDHGCCEARYTPTGPRLQEPFLTLSVESNAPWFFCRPNDRRGSWEFTRPAWNRSILGHAEARRLHPTATKRELPKRGLATGRVETPRGSGWPPSKGIAWIGCHHGMGFPCMTGGSSGCGLLSNDRKREK